MKKQAMGIALATLCLLGSSCASSRQSAYYDARPDNKKPVLVQKASKNYNIEDDKTFAAYKNAYTISQLEGKLLLEDQGHYQLYLTKDTTYLTVAYFCPQNPWFFFFNKDFSIIDRKTGDRYMLRGVEYFPTDTCFWINGAAGKYVRYVLEFPPLPKRVKVVDFFIPGTESRYNFDGNAKRENGLVVEELRPKTRMGKIIY